MDTLGTLRLEGNLAIPSWPGSTADGTGGVRAVIGAIAVDVSLFVIIFTNRRGFAPDDRGSCYRRTLLTRWFLQNNWREAFGQDFSSLFRVG